MSNRNYRSFRDMLSDVYYESIPLVSINLLWFLLCLPVVSIVHAWVGLHYAANRQVHREAVGWGTMWEGMRTYFWVALRWGVLNLLVYSILAFNLWFYLNVKADWGVWVSGMILGMLILWTVLQLYCLPVLFEQENHSLRTAIRNSLVIFVRRPFFTLGVLIGEIALMAAATLLLAPTWIVITAALVAYISNKATIVSLRKIGALQPEEDIRNI